MVFIHDKYFEREAAVFLHDYQDRVVYEAAWVDGEEVPRAFYYGDLAHGEEGFLKKRVFVGELLIAEVSEWAPGFSIGLTPVPEPPLELLIITGSIALMLLAFSPKARRLRHGYLVASGRVVGVCVVLGFGVMASMVLPAAAARANDPPPPGVEVSHFHFDHLGSTQAVTDAAGDLVHQVRYEPYGEIRGRFDGDGSPVASGSVTRQEFTGYVTNLTSGLMIAGLRMYDPITGQFMQQDPARQYASPYAYGPGDPMNGRDPTGAFFGLLIALAIAAAFVLANFLYTGITTGDWGLAASADLPLVADLGDHRRDQSQQ